MNHSFIVRPTLFIVAAAAVAACSSGSSTTSSAPAPAAAAVARPATNAATASAPMPAAATMSAAMIAQGDSIFHAASCRRCHGPDAKGAQNGPNLTGPTFLHVNGSYNDFVRIITSGVPADSIKDSSHRLAMRARGGTPALTDDQVKAVAAYVYSLSHKS